MTHSHLLSVLGTQAALTELAFLEAKPRAHRLEMECGEVKQGGVRGMRGGCSVTFTGWLVVADDLSDWTTSEQGRREGRAVRGPEEECPDSGNSERKSSQDFEPRSPARSKQTAGVPAKPAGAGGAAGTSGGPGWGWGTRVAFRGLPAPRYPPRDCYVRRQRGWPAPRASAVGAERRL